MQSQENGFGPSHVVDSDSDQQGFQGEGQEMLDNYGKFAKIDRKLSIFQNFCKVYCFGSYRANLNKLIGEHDNFIESSKTIQ